MSSKLCALAITIAFVQSTLLPEIAIQVFSGYTLQVSCSFNDTSNVITRFDVNGSEEFIPAVKVSHSGSQCTVKKDLPSADVQCICLHGTRVICNISRYLATNTREQWKCVIFRNTIPVLSNAMHATYKGTSQRTTKTISITEQINLTVSDAQQDAVVTMAHSLKYETHEGSHTSQVTDVSNESTIVLNTTEIFQSPVPSNEMFHRTFIITISIAGVMIVLLIGAIFTCVYKTYIHQRHSGTAIPAVRVHINDELPSSEDGPVILTSVDHNERIAIMVMPLIADNFPLSHDTFLDDNCIELEEDTASIHSYETIPDSPVFSVQVSNDNQEETVTQTISNSAVQYESLLRTMADVKSQYSALKSKRN